MKCNCGEDMVQLFRVYHEAMPSRPLSESRYTYYTWPVDSLDLRGNASIRDDTAVGVPHCPKCWRQYASIITKKVEEAELQSALEFVNAEIRAEEAEREALRSRLNAILDQLDMIIS